MVLRRFTRRALVGWLVRSSAAAATAGLLLPASTPRAHAVTHPATTSTTHHQAPPERLSIVSVDGPVPVRMADLVLAGRDLRAGLADGVRLPSQGGDAWSLAAERPGAAYTTPPLQAAFPCTHVGVHWRTDGGNQDGHGTGSRSGAPRRWLIGMARS